VTRAEAGAARSFARQLRARARSARDLSTRLRPVRHHGALFVPLPNDEIYVELANRRGFESFELTFVERVLQAGDVFWDLGANFGLYSVTASRAVGRNGQVVAVEPDPRNLRRLRANVLLNRCRNVETVGAAVGEVEGEVEFQSCEQGAYSGVRLGEHPGTARTISVTQTTLDDLGRSTGLPPNLVKMDIEGSELFALRSGTTVFEDGRPILLAEFSDRRTGPYGYAAVDIYDWLAERQYTMLRFDGASRLVHDKRRSTYDADNLVACPSEALGRLQFWLKA
jgi:FkbM family methyltransferase